VIRSTERLVKVDNSFVKGYSLDDLERMLGGPIGSDVTIWTTPLAGKSSLTIATIKRISRQECEQLTFSAPRTSQAVLRALNALDFEQDSIRFWEERVAMDCYQAGFVMHAAAVFAKQLRVPANPQAPEARSSITGAPTALNFFLSVGLFDLASQLAERVRQLASKRLDDLTLPELYALIDFASAVGRSLNPLVAKQIFQALLRSIPFSKRHWQLRILQAYGSLLLQEKELSKAQPIYARLLELLHKIALCSDNTLDHLDDRGRESSSERASESRAEAQSAIKPGQEGSDRFFELCFAEVADFFSAQSRFQEARTALSAFCLHLEQKLKPDLDARMKSLDSCNFNQLISLMRTKLKISSLCQAENDFSAARAIIVDALRLYEACLHGQDLAAFERLCAYPSISDVEIELAKLEMQLGELSASQQLFEAALSRMDLALGTESPLTRQPCLELAELYALQQDDQRGEVLRARARTLRVPAKIAFYKDRELLELKEACDLIRSHRWDKARKYVS
jgi:hypothetical protein